MPPSVPWQGWTKRIIVQVHHQYLSASLSVTPLWSANCESCGVWGVSVWSAAAGLPPVDGVDHSGLVLGTNDTSPRTEIPIGTEPRLSNVSGAPLCNSYGPSLIESFYDDSDDGYRNYLSIGFGPNDHCTTVRRLRPACSSCSLLCAATDTVVVSGDDGA